MPILTSIDVKQKRVTQIIRISKMAALEQQSKIKFCVANKKSRQETFKMLKTAFGNNAMKKTALYEGRSICNENSPVYPKVLYLQTS